MPEELWREVKAEAARRDVNIRDLVIEFLRDGLKRK